MTFTVVVDVEFQEATPFERRAFHEEMLSRKWTRFPLGDSAYCARVRGCRTEAEAVSAVEAEIESIAVDAGMHQWSAVCYLPDDMAAAC